MLDVIGALAGVVFNISLIAFLLQLCSVLMAKLVSSFNVNVEWYSKMKKWCLGLFITTGISGIIFYGCAYLTS